MSSKSQGGKASVQASKPDTVSRAQPLLTISAAYVTVGVDAVWHGCHYPSCRLTSARVQGPLFLPVYVGGP